MKRATPSAGGAAGSGIPRARILVVDDTRANRIVLRRLLEAQDADLQEAASGAEAISACLDQEFALILLDVVMEGMDGFEVARHLSEIPRARDTPIIFITAAKVDELSRIRGYGSGAVDYIVKPINDVILQSKVRVFLELYRGKQALTRALDEQKRLEELARERATHDPLTGLPNRQLFMDRLENLVERARRRPTRGALLYIDIDGFKPVNDRYGHHTGDELLKAIARRMAEVTRKVDTVARLGGDEFAVLLDEPITPAAALAKARSLIRGLKKPFRLSGTGKDTFHKVTIGASIGLAYYPDDCAEPDALIQAADAAMYQAKRTGTNLCRRAKT
jgi:diguanylate cyclase (GGDEF)-like protein